MLQFVCPRDAPQCCETQKKKMFFNADTRYRIVFLIICIVLINVVSLDARRSWSRSSSRGSSSSSRSRTTYTSPPRWTPSAPSRSSPPTHHTSKLPDSWMKKESSNTLIHSEGGGRPRPGISPVNDHKPQPTHRQPSAPIEPINRATATNVQNSANPGGSYPSWANPGAAPHVAPNRNTPGSSPNHGTTFPNGPFNSIQTKPTGPIATAPYAPIHPPGPISHQAIKPSYQPTQTVGAPQGSYPHPNSPHGMPAPYPPSVPYPGGHPPGMPMPNAPHIGFGNGGHVGGVNQPVGSPHNYHPLGTSPMQPHNNGQPTSTVIHNHYNAPPIGSPHNPAGHPNYANQPYYGGPPVNQAFVPGQTTVFLPSQQSSGPGIGQLVKEALVFSTVNAGVNRLINGAPHHHDHYQPVQSALPAAVVNPAPVSSTSTVTHTTIYNNQYGPPNPTGNGDSPVPVAPPAPGAPPVPANSASGQPVVMPRNQSPFPGIPSIANDNNSAGTGSSSPSIQIPNSGPPPAGPQFSILPSSVPSATSRPDQVNATNTATVQPNAATTNNTNNQTTTPAFEYYISNAELWNLTETLFKKDEYNASQYVTLNLQNRQTDPNSEDVAPAPLLYVERDAYGIPTIKILREIYSNFEFNSSKKENITDDARRRENIMLDVFLETNIMTATMSWLSQKGYIEPDSFEWKDTLRHIWLTKVNGATSGFERIFLAEKYDGPEVLGGQNWVYIDDDQGAMKRINYMGYVDSINLGQKCNLIKINQKIDGVVKSNTTMLVGTPPELEMALYTICYFARPNDVCNVSLGGVKFNVYTHPFRYFGKDLIDLGLMFF